MKIPVTLSFYFGRVFAVAVGFTVAALTGLVALFDFLELLREAATTPRANFGMIVEIELLRLPWTALQILPFAILLGGMYAFWRLSRSSELIVARAAGVSAWQFLAAPVLAAILFGAIGTAVISPISAKLYAQAESIYNSDLKVGGSPLSTNNGELWVRQADHGLVSDGFAILHADGVQLDHKQLQANQVSILRLDPQNNLLERIEADNATLDAGAWNLVGARILHIAQPPQIAATLPFPTDLTVHRVEESFASPNSLSFWALPSFITLLKRSGFSPIQHELAFQALAALPLLCGTMALVAAGFSMRPARRGAPQMLVSGVACGFALFMISQVANQFGTSGAIPVSLAAWAPAAAGLCLALALLLHLEDG